MSIIPKVTFKKFYNTHHPTWKIILIFHIYLKNVKNLWIVLLHFYISNSWIYNRNGLVLRWHFSCNPSHTTTFLLTHCAKLPSLRKHVSKSYRNLDEATEILTPHAPLFSRVHIEKKIAKSFLVLCFLSPLSLNCSE